MDRIDMVTLSSFIIIINVKINKGSLVVKTKLTSHDVM